MRSVLVLSVALLAACVQPPCEGLARLATLRAACAADWRAVGEGICKAAAEVYRRRFFSGRSGPEEYTALEALPPIPASFDAPDGAWGKSDPPVASAKEPTP
ncbi:hypothetical protein [Stutzerimonas stutzeri]|uniref:hypothetical protein n=1 Tax=Stutzerimonas stutzeri TaxID=316 RepID=UPI00244A8286|nr:hypothetical protein [Stutzerimonas stutzeri]MDH0059479.1 hypothetical protein [Stutzerimonas stutzeri]